MEKVVYCKQYTLEAFQNIEEVFKNSWQDLNRVLEEQEMEPSLGWQIGCRNKENFFAIATDSSDGQNTMEILGFWDQVRSQ